MFDEICADSSKCMGDIADTSRKNIYPDELNDPLAEIGIGDQNRVDSNCRGLLTPKSKASRLNLNSCACTGQALTCVGRYLLILSALSLLTMPITEHLWTWDRFLQTGRDFEIGTLMALSVFCLVLVLSKQCKQCVESFLSRWSILAFQFIDRVIPAICLPAKISVFCAESVNSPGTGMCHFPLQI